MCYVYKINMRKIIITISLFLFLNQHLYSQELKINNTFYISPGVNIAWDFDGHFIIGPKVSLGYFYKLTFYNLTFGYMSSKNNDLYPIYYIEGQVGAWPDMFESKNIMLFVGLGWGIAIHEKLDKNISFKLSLFGGDIIFLNASFLFNKGLYPNLGTETVLPIPITTIK